MLLKVNVMSRIACFENTAIWHVFLLQYDLFLVGHTSKAEGLTFWCLFLLFLLFLHWQGNSRCFYRVYWDELFLFVEGSQEEQYFLIVVANFVEISIQVLMELVKERRYKPDVVVA